MNIETNDAIIGDGDVVRAVETDTGLVFQPITIEDYFQEIQRDLFLKWDQLENRKAKLRNRKQDLKDNRFVSTVLSDSYCEAYDFVIDAIEGYQGELETSQEVLEFEETQHADGKR